MGKALLVLIGLGVVGSILSGIKKLVGVLVIIGLLLAVGMYAGVI